MLVVGAGVAGTAAALAAARAGALVTIVDGGTGASTLATGALDVIGWEKTSAAGASPITAAVRDLLEALGGYLLPHGGARLLTTAGVIRAARGHDAALLDVELLGASRIGVVRCDRPGWDADALASAWAEGRRERGPAMAPDSCTVVDATVLRHTDERDLPDADFAARHDDDARLAWLAERLRAALGAGTARVGALALPPCLGVDRARARSLSERVGLPCGEALGAPGGPAGLRFERARDRALSVLGVERACERAKSVTKHTTGWSVDAESGWTREADAVVLATGGLVGGGIEYSPGESVMASALPPFARLPFRASLDAPLHLGAHGRALELPSTLFGQAPESLAWPFARDPLMDRVGVLSDEQGRVAPGLLVAGELRADRPRTWIDALATGAAAGAAAADDALSAERRSRSSFPAPPIRP